MVLEKRSVTVVGLGLMGGSFGMALKANRACREVIGVARRPETVTVAQELGAVDRATTELGIVAEADVVVLATPVRSIVELVPSVGGLVRPGCLVMDLGSTKAAIGRAMDALPKHVQAIGGHPMCGKETSGLAAAESALYRGKVFVLTPLDRTHRKALALAHELVDAIGARPVVLTPERHDRLVAATSHLSYLMACGLVQAAEALAQGDQMLWELAASGFRDTSRLAGSDVTMMMDTLLTNREAILEALGICTAELDRLAEMVREADEYRLRRTLGGARERRRSVFP
jgi:prephenate dehydrogenase